mgnify:CR=1 FL=1
MGNKGRFVKNSLLFLLGSGLSKALGIIMLPLYTSHIPTEDYGAYDISLTLITIVSSIAFFELWSAVLRFMYDFSKEDKKRRSSNPAASCSLAPLPCLSFSESGSAPFLVWDILVGCSHTVLLCLPRTTSAL